MVRSYRKSLALLLAAFLLAVTFSISADAFWSRRNLEPFNPDVDAPHPYDPNSVGYGGAGSARGGGPSDCYWSREEIFIGGRLTWRPLKMCPYGYD